MNSALASSDASSSGAKQVSICTFVRVKQVNWRLYAAMAVVAAQRLARGFGGDAVWRRTTGAVFPADKDESLGTQFSCFTGTKSTNSDAEGAAGAFSRTQSAHA